MAVNYIDRLKAEQQKVDDLLRGQKSAFDPYAAQTADIVTSGRRAYEGDVADVLGGVSSQFGIAPDIVSSARPTVAAEGKKMDRQFSETTDRQRMKNRERVYNLVFNTALDNFVNAGMDLQTAYAKARQVALDKSQQAFQSREADLNRQATQSKVNVASSYQERMDGIAANDPFEQAVVSALAGTAARGASIYALRDKKQATSPQLVSDSYGGPGTLRDKSMFGYRDNFGGY